MSGATPYTQDFNTLASTGTANTWTDNSTIPGWYSNRSTYLAGTGTLNTGGLYSFGTTSERALGSVASGSTAPIYGIIFTNNTGSAITSVQVSYTGEQWRNGGNTSAQSLTFAYATGATLSLTGVAATEVSALNFTSPVTSPANNTAAVALDGNVAPNRTALTATIAFATPVAAGNQLLIRWLDANDLGNDHGLAIDDLSVTFTTSGPPTSPTLSVNPITLTIAATTQGIVSSPQSYTITAQQLTAPITVTAPANFEISSDNITYSGTLNLAQSTTLATVYARLTGATQGSFSGSITNVSGAQSANAAVSGTVNAAAGTFTKISAIQGSGNTFAVGGSQNIEGIVTQIFAGTAGQNGFYVQEEDADQDGNPATSEGIFCYDPSGTFSGNVGDKVRVTGTVAEFASTSNGVSSSVTQLANISTTVVSSGNALPSLITATLPIPTAVGGVAYLERFEGMLVQVSAASGNLTVTEVFGLQQYGQVTLSATDATNQAGTDGRIEQYTQFNAPSVSGFAAYEANAALRKIILDDGSAVAYPGTIIHARGGNPLSATNTLRGGDNVASITAILDERFDGYRLQINTGVNFTAANPRPSTPPTVSGTLRVGGANVLNYFTTFGGANDRGADNQAEFDRQRAKVIANLIGTGADVLAMSEVQNNGYGPTSAIQNLVDGLNASAANTYAFVTPNATSATDFITAALIYKPAIVSLVGPGVPIPGSYGTGSFGTVGRSAIAQTFQQINGGGIFTVVVNHWKSKGSASTGSGNADAGDGQALSNGIRTHQAQDLLSWLATKPTGTQDPDYLLVGDFNSYAREDPLTTLEAGTYVAKIPTTSYSFAFKGEWGSLDHAFASNTLDAQVTGATKWYINSDEPTALDYNTENKTAAQITNLFSYDQYRSADHDPLVVGLDLTVALPVQLVDFRATVIGDQVSLGWETTMEKDADRFVVERSTDLREFGAVGQVTSAGNSTTRRVYSLIDAAPHPGTNYYRLRTVNQDGTSQLSKVVAATIDDVTPAMAVTGNPISDGKIRLAVRNMAGATYQLRTITGQAIRTTVTSRNDRVVELQLGQAIGAGIYLLEGNTGTSRQVVKLLTD